MTVYLSGPFDYPVAGVLLVEPAGITDPAGLTVKIFDLTPLVFTCGDATYIITTVPECDFTATFITFAVGIHWLWTPYPLYQPERPVCYRTDGANIYHIPAKVIVHRLRYICADLSMFAPVEHAMHSG